MLAARRRLGQSVSRALWCCLEGPGVRGVAAVDSSGSGSALHQVRRTPCLAAGGGMHRALAGGILTAGAQLTAGGLWQALTGRRSGNHDDGGARGACERHPGAVCWVEACSSWTLL